MISLLERTENRVGEVTVNTTNDEYDGLNRLYKRERKLGGYTNTETYTYISRTVNGAGTTYLPASLTQSADSTCNESFSYDANGNIAPKRSSLVSRIRFITYKKEPREIFERLFSCVWV